jgi:acetyl-CoA acetyltransferase
MAMSPQAEKRARQRWLEERGAIQRLSHLSEQAKTIAKTLNLAIRGNFGAIATVKLDPSSFGVDRGAPLEELLEALERAQQLYTVLDLAIDGEPTAIASIKLRSGLSYLI